MCLCMYMCIKDKNLAYTQKNTCCNQINACFTYFIIHIEKMLEIVLQAFNVYFVISLTTQPI